MTLEQVANLRRTFAVVESEHAPLGLLVCDGEAMMPAEVLDPVGTVVALDPSLRVGRVLHKSPAARAVPSADASQLAHLCQEPVRIGRGNPVLDGDHDGT